MLERLGPHPDLAVVPRDLASRRSLEDIGATIAEVLSPSVLIGGASESIVGTGREVEGGLHVGSGVAARFIRSLECG